MVDRLHCYQHSAPAEKTGHEEQSVMQKPGGWKRLMQGSQYWARSTKIAMQQLVTDIAVHQRNECLV